MSHRAQNRDSNGGQRSGQVIPHSQDQRERPLLSSSGMMPRCHQRRWSADVSTFGTPPVIIVKKNRKEPQPPERGASLCRPHTAAHPSFKRYSCPPMGMLILPRHSSYSSSSTSSCSSPPPMKTSAITGPDPLGWKLRLKSTSTSPRARTNRLSLQIPLPVVFPNLSSKTTPASQSDNAPNQAGQTKPPLRVKPSRRHHSDSSAFLRSLHQPVVKLQELHAGRLRSAAHSEESDDVFSDGNEEGEKATTQRCKIPPPVPDKTAMARQIAKLIAHSLQRHTNFSPKTREENLYSRVMKPKQKHSHQTVDHNNLKATRSAELHVTSSTVRFSGREV